MDCQQKINKRISAILLGAFLVFSANGCSQKQAYQGIQDTQKQECVNLPISDQEDCRKQYETPYEDYERQRKPN